VARAQRVQPVALVVFDLLRDGKRDLVDRPFTERRAMLEKLGLGASGSLRLGRSVRGDGRALMAEAHARGWEGLVAKVLASPYRAGKRSAEWRKLKIAHRQELVVGGYTEPKGGRSGFGALVLGVWEGAGRQRRLRPAGSVGTGFSDRDLRDLGAKLRKLEVAACPFSSKPETMGKPHWVRPELVVEVSFAEWTSARILRHPVFLGVRDDKDPRDVVREDARASRAAPGRSRGRATPGRNFDTAAFGYPDVVAALAVLERGKGEGVVELPDGKLKVTNLRKVFFPALGLTKGDLLRHYARVARIINPALADRPLVLQRHPDGVGGTAFYQQRPLSAVPGAVRAERVVEREGKAEVRLIGGGASTLLYTIQLGAISFDPWFVRADAPDVAVDVAIDLDPMPDVPFSQVLDVARWLRDELVRLGVPAFPKTSGATGIHIFIPMPPGTPLEAGLLLCRLVCTPVAAAHHEACTLERSIPKRGARVYLDCYQNIRGKALASVYSVRANEFAGVSTPLLWSEVDAGVDPHDFTMTTIEARLGEVGDLWAALRASPGVDLAAVLARAKA